jgi:hypothetical protein
MPTHQSRRHAASLLVPATETRHARRARIKAERSLVTDQERARAAAARQQRTDEQAALLDAPPAPRAGERRPAAGRTWRRLRVQAHRATSATLAAAYPFLAEAGLGGAGILVGTDAYSRRSFVYDPWVLYQRGVLTNPNLAVAGEIGAGKSALLKSLVSRSLCFGRRAYVPGDPKGEWTPLTRAVGGTALELGRGMPTRINPLDAGTRPVGLAEDEWRRDVRARRLGLLTSLAETLMGRPLQPVEHTAVAAALDTAAVDHDPVLSQVVHTMLDPDTTTSLPPGVASRDRLAEDGRSAAHALARLVFGDLAGLFDQASTARFDPDAPMISIDVSRIGEDNALIPLVMACTSVWMEAALRDPAGGHRWMVYDEAWKLMRNPALVRRMETQWRLSRAWGLANVLAVHQLADFNAVGAAGSEARARASTLLALTSTRVVYRQPADQLDTTAAAMGLNTTETELLPTLPRGRALWRIGTRAFVVDHLLTEREQIMFDTDTRMSEGHGR